MDKRLRFDDLDSGIKEFKTSKNKTDDVSYTASVELKFDLLDENENIHVMDLNSAIINKIRDNFKNPIKY